MTLVQQEINTELDAIEEKPAKCQDILDRAF